MNGSQIATNYGSVSVVVTAIGIGTWFAAWKDTTNAVPWNRWLRDRYPRYFRRWLATRRLGIWITVVGLANLVIAIVLMELTS